MAYDLVVYTEPRKRIENIWLEKVLKNALTLLKEEISQLEFKRKTTHDLLLRYDQEHPELANQVWELEQELADLEGRDAATRPKQLSSPDQILEAERQKATEAAAALEKLREDKTPQGVELQRLYRKIAIRCHPDKTDDENLHDILVMAKQALVVGDLNIMRQLWKNTQGYIMLSKLNSTWVGFLRDRLKSVGQQRQDVADNLKVLESSFEYEFYTLMCARDLKKADKLYRERVKATVAELQWKIDRLRNRSTSFYIRF